MRFDLHEALPGLRAAVAWRVRRALGDDRVDRAIVKSAQCWRPLLKKPIFIGVAGSVGKSTAKELLVGILSRTLRGIGNPATLNVLPEVAKTTLRLRPWDDFCVVELSEHRPGTLGASIAVAQPSIGIVTVVGSDHRCAYGSREAIAAEISMLITSLPPTGTAVLNADDELVLAMRAYSAAKVITYGDSPNAELRAEDVSSVWPDRLQMTLVHGGERVPLRTQLCGSHWVPSVLGAVGGGLAVGMTLAECAEGIASIAPFEGRMQPVATPDGVTFIRDDFKAPLWTVDASFDFMKTARAKRKIVVIGTLSDCGPGTSKRYADVARRAQEFADVTIFVGTWASSALRARKGKEEDLRAFSHVRDAGDYVNSITREGDLVLLKGSNKQDHLLRILLARTDAVACWRDDCERSSFCNECADRTKPSGVRVLLQRQITLDARPQVQSPSLCAVDSDEQVIVGLGNPGAQYAGTPHNAGYEVVDRLAAKLGLAWDATPVALIARGASRRPRVCLVKIRTPMNRIGAELKQLSESMSFSPEQCILVHDDLATPIGAVRTRLRGGAGGHRGVASILEAFQSDSFRRVKVGVGNAGADLDRVAYVLAAFDAANRSIADRGIAAAEVRIIELAESRVRSP